DSQRAGTRALGAVVAVERCPAAGSNTVSRYAYLVIAVHEVAEVMQRPGLHERIRGRRLTAVKPVGERVEEIRIDILESRCGCHAWAAPGEADGAPVVVRLARGRVQVLITHPEAQLVQPGAVVESVLGIGAIGPHIRVVVVVVVHGPGAVDV